MNLARPPSFRVNLKASMWTWRFLLSTLNIWGAHRSLDVSQNWFWPLGWADTLTTDNAYVTQQIDDVTQGVERAPSTNIKVKDATRDVLAIKKCDIIRTSSFYWCFVCYCLLNPDYDVTSDVTSPIDRNVILCKFFIQILLIPLELLRKMSSWNNPVNLKCLKQTIMSILRVIKFEIGTIWNMPGLYHGSICWP